MHGGRGGRTSVFKIQPHPWTALQQQEWSPYRVRTYVYVMLFWIEAERRVPYRVSFFLPVPKE